MENKKYFYINNQKIGISFYHLIVRECGGNAYAAQRVFYKCRLGRNVKSMVRFCVRNGEIFTTTTEMDYNKMQMESWIDAKFNDVPVEQVKKNVDRKKDPDSIMSILGGVCEAAA